jgi:predicted HTH domain antitoxin
MTSPYENVLDRLEQSEQFLFLLLYAPVCGRISEPVRGKTWLQKEMYVISRNIPLLHDELAYDTFRYGSFSETVEEIKDQYQISNYVESPKGMIRLTLKGEKLASCIWQTISPQTRKLVQDVKEEFNDMTEDELLLFMYVTYPDTAEVSDVKDRIMKERFPLSVSLLKKGKVSLQKAAELAGMNVEEFMCKARAVIKP